MSLALSRVVCGVLARQSAPSSILRANGHVIKSPWIASVLTLKTSAPLSAEPKKKKKADPRRDLIVRERLKKRLKKLEKVAPELIPIEDFIVPSKCLDDTRLRLDQGLSFEERERRALLLKDWSRYKQIQHKAEMEAIDSALEAQREALEELKAESEELYLAALKPDPSLFPFSHEGPCFTPPIAKHDAPEGKYNDVTKVYTQ